MNLTKDNNNNVKLEINNNEELSYVVVEVYFEYSFYIYSKVFFSFDEMIFENVTKGSYLFKVLKYNNNGDVFEVIESKITVSAVTMFELESTFRDILENPTYKDLLFLMKDKPLSLRHLFIKFRTMLHGSGMSFKKNIFLNLCFAILNSEKSLSIPQKVFLLSCLVYGVNNDELIANYNFLNEKINDESVPCFERYFINGLLNYRCGNYFIAEKNFEKLIAFKDVLMSHQLISTIYKFFYRDVSNVNSEVHYNILNKGVGETGVILISSDLGYYLTYSRSVIDSLKSKDILVHFHLVIPEGYDISCLDTDKNIGLSYEYESVSTRESNIHYKTYYSVVRYLLARDISKIYNKSVLIADIDIDFTSANLDSIFDELSDDEAALVFSKLTLPWTNILAGFNFFGKKFLDSEFYFILCSFIEHNIKQGQNFWMLDQVALSVAYANSDKENISKIRSMREINLTPIKQQNENSSLKHKAREHILKVINDLKAIEK